VNDLLPDLQTWIDRGDRIALATVVSVKKSAPRPPGAKMAVNESGEIIGAVSGGCVEGAVVGVADEVLQGGPPRLVHFGIADEEAWDVGLPCGGEIDVWVQELTPGPFVDIAAAGGRAAEITLLEGDQAGAKLLVAEGEGVVSGGLGSPQLDAQAQRDAEDLIWAETSELRGPTFVDVVGPSPRVIVFGAVPVAAALCSLARAAGWRAFVVDPRTRFATQDRFPDAERVIAAWPDEAFAELGGIDPASSIAVLTHDPKLDDAALGLALRSPARFIGAMGSRRAQESRRERLLSAGFTDAELERLSAPVGLDLGALSAEETALSILAEMIAVSHGRDGGRLKTAGGRIHEIAA
jgi:xanthine dehydrogenase accessory factor